MLKKIISMSAVLSILFGQSLSSAQVVLLVNKQGANTIWAGDKCKAIQNELAVKALCLWQDDFAKNATAFITNEKTLLKTVDYYETSDDSALMRVIANPGPNEKVETNWGLVSSSAAEVALLVVQVIEQTEIEARHPVNPSEKPKNMTARSSQVDIKSLTSINLDKKTIVAFDVGLAKDNNDQFRLAGERQSRVMFSLNLEYKFK